MSCMHKRFQSLSSLALLIGSVGAAHAQDTCSAILKNERGNYSEARTKFSRSSLVTLSEKESAQSAESFFSLDTEAAFAQYQNAVKQISSKTLNGNASGNYGFIGGSVSFARTVGSQMDRSTFEQTYNQKRNEYNKSSEAQSNKEVLQRAAKQAASENLRFSSSRDKATVDAWALCMATHQNETGLVALGFRDRSGNPFMHVIWVPGPFAATFPSIEATVTPVDSAVEIAGPPTVTIGAGPGMNFVIRRAGNTGSGRILPKGFAVQVNGNLKDKDGKTVSTFGSSAEIPALRVAAMPRILPTRITLDPKFLQSLRSLQN